MKTTTFTSTISPQLLNWVRDYSKKTKQTRHTILENALTYHKAEEIRRQMRADFKRASNGKKALNLLEWGMGDYYEIVTTRKK